ncbi:hypothetical protein VB779_09370 [Haloarculaceae archaeon H-GB11]|nr:hypothetical protein [Haloarculaceae archaeon H-GB11]
MAEDKWIGKLENIADTDSDGLTNVVPKAMLLPVMAFMASLADAIGAAFGVPIATFEGFSDAVDVLIEGFVAAPGGILKAGADQSASSLTSGVWAQFGPFTFVIAAGVVVLAALVVARVRDEPETGNFLVGLPFDVPLFGTEEDDED